MSKERDFYEVLGVDRSASSEDIQAAYKKLARQYHPDRPGGNAEKFKEINNAYESLKDPQKRQQYDTFGTAGDQGFGGFQGGSGGFDQSFFENIFSNFGGDSSFSFSYGGGRSNQPIRGADLQMNYTITLEELFRGTNVEVGFDTYTHCSPCKASGYTGKGTCSTCKGKGYTSSNFDIFNFRNPCPYCNRTGQSAKDVCKTCNGEGRTRQHVKHTLKVPKGYDVSQPLIYVGLGEAGIRTSKNPDLNGNLILKIALEKHNIFTKIQGDLHMDYSLDLQSAMLGTQISVTGIDGKTHHKHVDPIVNDCSIIIEGEGFWLSHKIARRGNLIVHLKITLPKITSDVSKVKLLDFIQTVKR